MTKIDIIKKIDACVANADGIIGLIVRLFDLFKEYKSQPEKTQKEGK